MDISEGEENASFPTITEKAPFAIEDLCKQMQASEDPLNEEFSLSFRSIGYEGSQNAKVRKKLGYKKGEENQHWVQFITEGEFENIYAWDKFFSGDLGNLNPNQALRVMISHNMDSGEGLSGAPVYAGNKKFSEKFLSKKGIDGQERRDYCFDNVLIGL